ncbi:YcnI family copper-binding membrane protein [Paenibacillus segetis]|uniref:YncI copper-binding domain-containing protein n=1 Tax=Paenibacillus segetis TaxID=1325360 RepID=A0ABQ1YUG2_9BACL|nr:YcnI family protein [Paenibacillus segetis]GGH37542.1 hypothetical protein GCM10008013_45070 [Paenibacillus segetis]
MKTFKNRLSILSLITLTGLLLFSGIASAHVTVKPGVSSPGAWETYSIKIPVEKDIPTVKISLKIPSGLEFKQYRPVPDWKVELVKDETGLVTTVTWETEGEGIQPEQFQEFEFVAKNPSDEMNLAWDAYQYYSDGSIVEWTGEENADKPHSITKVTTQAVVEATDGHDHDGEHTSDSGIVASPNEGAEAAQNGSSTANILSTVLSGLALLVSIIALWISLRSTKKSS